MRAHLARAGRRPRRPGRLLLALLLVQVCALTGLQWQVGAAAPPCDPPPPACQTPPCMPDTGGGGGGDYCATHPTDPDCARTDGGVSPDNVIGASASDREQDDARVIVAPLLSGALSRSWETIATLSAPPCDPTPVPLLPLPDPQGVATRLGRDLEGNLPTVTLRANPTLGLVNLESWFWAEGYDGRDFRASESFASPPYESAMTVAARCTPRSYRWEFGDGGGAEMAGKEGLGVNASGGHQSSSVRHTYKAARLDEGYPVYLTIEWLIEYRINDGPPQSLTIVTRQFVMMQRVQEVQPIIVR